MDEFCGRDGRMNERMKVLRKRWKDEWKNESLVLQLNRGNAS